METTETPDNETSSAEYARRFSGSAGRYLLAVQSSSVSKALRGLTPGTSLDVGGGHGQLVDLLRNMGWRATVQGSGDVSERNLRELHGKRDCGFIRSSMYALPAEDRSFDLVISVRLLSHASDWRALVAEMCRVARGAVVVDYPCKSGLNALTPWLFKLKKKMEGNTRTYLSFTRDELCGEFARHGFVFKCEVKQFFLPMVIHRVGRGALPFRVVESICRMLGLTAWAGSPAILRMDRQL